MLEIKYLKELPARFVNKNTNAVVLRGADMYVDVNGNRFVYIAFDRASKNPFYSLYLGIKEYDLDGTLIKEEKYMESAIYVDEPMYVIQQPIPVEKECDAIDVYVACIEYKGKLFIQDDVVKFRNVTPEEIFNNIPEANGNFMVRKSEDKVKDRFAGVANEKVEAGPKEDFVPTLEAPVNHQDGNENAEGEEAVEEAPKNDSRVRLTTKNAKVLGKKLSSWLPILVAALVGVGVIALIWFMGESLIH